MAECGEDLSGYIYTRNSTLEVSRTDYGNNNNMSQRNLQLRSNQPGYQSPTKDSNQSCTTHNHPLQEVETTDSSCCYLLGHSHIFLVVPARLVQMRSESITSRSSPDVMSRATKQPLSSSAGPIIRATDAPSRPAAFICFNNDWSRKE